MDLRSDFALAFILSVNAPTIWASMIPPFHHFYFVLVLVIAQMPSVYINFKTSIIYIYIEKKQTL